MLDERKRQILDFIIQDYVDTAVPVGSRTITRKYNVGVSPATIRNEMSDLEALGYLEQPHVSAGRVPSVKAYRLYVDDLIAGKGWVPLPALEADVRNITPQNGSFTSGFDRGRCVVTATCQNPALVCAWLDQMYDPFQSPQNNWGTYGEDDDFDIFVLGKNADGEDMLQHAPLGDASPVEVREAECVAGPLAILDSYYGVYVTCPDDAQYRLDWIKDIYTPDMNGKYVFPNVFMTTDDTKTISNLQADITKRINTAKADWVMNGFTDADWDQLQSDLKAYKLDEYLAIFQKYFDAYNK